MKTILSLVILSGLYFYYGHNATQEILPIGLVESSSGTNFVVRNGAKIQITDQYEIESHDEFIVSQNGFLKITLQDHHKMFLSPFSQVSFINKGPESDLIISLKKGKARIKAGSELTLSTPNGQWRVSNSDFIISHELDESSLVVITGGVLDLESKKKILGQTKLKILANLAQESSQVDEADFQFIKTMLLSAFAPQSFPLTKWTQSVIREVASENQEVSSQEESSQELIQLSELIMDSTISLEEKKEAISSASSEIREVLEAKLGRYEKVKHLKNKILPKLQDESSFAQLQEKEKKAYLSQYQEYLDEQVSILNENKQAMPLRTSDGRILYFDDYPELKESLPKDSEGNIIALNIDENMDLSGSIPAGEEISSDKKIAVINQNGEVEMKALVNSQNLIALVPMDANSEFKGVDVSGLSPQEEEPIGENHEEVEQQDEYANEEEENQEEEVASMD